MHYFVLCILPHPLQKGSLFSASQRQMSTLAIQLGQHDSGISPLLSFAFLGLGWLRHAWPTSLRRISRTVSVTLFPSYILPSHKHILHFTLVSVATKIFLQWNLWNKDTTGPYKRVLISEVSLIRRFPYNSYNIMLYNSGPWTLVRIVEVSVIGGVRFWRFHCNIELV